MRYEKDKTGRQAGRQAGRLETPARRAGPMDGGGTGAEEENEWKE